MTVPEQQSPGSAGGKSISAYGAARSTIGGTPLTPEELRKIEAYWQTSLYLCLGMLYLKENPLLREPLELQHVKPRLLGHWGSDAGQCFTYIHFNRLINKYDLNAICHLRSRARRAGRAFPGISRRDLCGDLPGQERRPRRDAAVLQAVLLSRRHRQPRHAGNARQHPRRGRAGLQRFARLRHRLRPPGPDHPGRRGRRRVGDRSPGDELARQQVPQSDHRRRGAARLAPQRLQDQQSHRPGPHQPRGTGGAVRRLRVHAATLSKGAITQSMHQAMAATTGTLRVGNPQVPGGGAAERARPSGPAGR